MKSNTQDLIIIGGGIMGLFTAYYASLLGTHVTILEKSTIGNEKASSFSLTRSIRNDYLDPVYARFAFEAQSLWRSLQNQSKKQFFFPCGCLNVAKDSVTPGISQTYALQSYEVISSLNFKVEKFSKAELEKRFPQFKADIGVLDVNAGFLYLPVITDLLLKLLRQNGVQIIENVTVKRIEENQETIVIQTSENNYKTKKLVITVGIWINEVLKTIKDNTLTFPLSPDRPQECKYVYPPERDKQLFMSDKFPVFAYLDVGIYGHPIFDKEKGAIKIGYYNPPDMKRQENQKITSVANFINECIPLLKGARMEDVTDADQCSYDLVADDDFILGRLPKFQNIFVGTGWRGTGYKFAPLIGKILMQYALQKDTVYNIARFSPERFKDYEKE